MPRLVTLYPLKTSTAYQQENKQELDIVPDGTGLQILFDIDGETYLIAGARSNGLLTVNGGKIENTEESFLKQLAEEFKEETFGIINIAHEEGIYYLILKDHGKHRLTVLSEKTVLDHEPGDYAYVTFTARCSSVTLEQLGQIAKSMTPTAGFWNKLGNYLHDHAKKAPKEDDQFSKYWESEQKSRNRLIAELTDDYKKIKSTGELLIDPLDVFQAENIEDILNKISSYKELDKVRHIVGNYSERASYHVINVKNLLSFIQNQTTSINDITGRKVASYIFNTATRIVLENILMQNTTKEDLTGYPSQAGKFKPPSKLPTDNLAPTTPGNKL